MELTKDLEKTLEVQQGPIRDGEFAIRVIGDVVTRRCSYEGCRFGKREFKVPCYVFNGDNKVRREYCDGIKLSNGIFVDGREFSNGVYASREGNLYCCLGCWSDQVSD